MNFQYGCKIQKERLSVCSYEAEFFEYGHYSAIIGRAIYTHYL